MSSKFANYVTNVAFNLTLSKAMCAVLLAVQAEEKRKPKKGKADWEDCLFIQYSHFVPVIRNLENRGLVSYHPTPLNEWGKSVMNINHKTHRLTAEGKLVAELVKRAGIATLANARQNNQTTTHRINKE